MPAPRRAILSDIAEFELSAKKKLTVGKDGRLCPSPIKEAVALVEEVQEIPQSQLVVSYAEPSVIQETLEQTSKDSTVTAIESVVEAEELPPLPPTLEPEKPKQTKSGRFKKKETAGSV